MYTRIISPNITIFNGNTNEFIGRATFNLTPEAEKVLLGLVNYNNTPQSLVLRGLDFYQQSTYFDPPTTNEPTSRKGILSAIFVNSFGELIPMEIRIRYDAIARGNVTGSHTFFESAEYNNIVVDSIERVSY